MCVGWHSVALYCTHSISVSEKGPPLLPGLHDIYPTYITLASYLIVFAKKMAQIRYSV